MNGLQNKKNLRLALPNKGRLLAPARKLLEDMGLKFDVQERKLFSPGLNSNVDLLFLRAGDIPKYLAEGIVDAGITGQDLIIETNSKVAEHLKLNFGKCDVVLAAPANSKIKSIKDLAGKTVATSFVRITKNFFKQEKINVNVIEMSGAVEITPWLGIADAIVDITSTGESLEMNNLEQIHTIMQSQAVLVANKEMSPVKQKALEKLVAVMQGVINGYQKKYLMMNAPEASLEKIKKIIPGLSSPTILKLAEPGMIAIHSVVDDNKVWDLIPRLREVGATGILISPIEKLIY